ncbi:MAG: LamG-like jellyroll fold domain-containing protein, partial [Promethearchaeota archaeon]
HENIFQFYDGFESGDVSAWNGSYTDTGDTLIVLNTPLIPVHSGTYAVRGDVDDVAAAQAMVWKDFSDKSNLIARVHFYLPVGFSTSDHVTIMQYVDTSSGWQNQLSLTIRDDMTLYMWNAIAGEAYGYGTTSTISTGSWHTLDMQAKISDTAGEARLWLDGNLEIEDTGINLGTEGIDRFCTVFYWASPQTEPNTVIADDAFLRPYVSPEPISIVGPEISQELVLNYKKDITIDHTKVSADLDDFPLLIDIFDADLRTKVQSDGDDIIFKSGEVILPHEIEVFDQSYNSSHAHLVAWVKTDLQSSTDTVITMYYGNPSVESLENAAGLWVSNYKGVWHLGETSNDAKDSTSYGTDGTLIGNPTRGIPGQVGYAYDFDAIDDVVNFGDPVDGHLDFGLNSFTVSIWINIEGSTGTWQLPLYKGGSSNSDQGYEFETSTDGLNFLFYAGDGLITMATDWGCTVVFGSWMYFVGVVDRGSQTITIYKNGVEFGTPNPMGPIGSVSSDKPLVISRDMDGRRANATVDEVRVSSEARSAAWILTEFNNQYDPASFFAVGSEISSAPLEFSYKKDITIDHTKVSTDLTDFPLLIDIFDSDLRTKVQPNGEDIVFKSGENVLSHEIEVFDQSYNGSHAHLVAWVKTDLSSSVDTTITMYYGNPNIGSQENAAGVWSSNFKGVWHLGEDPTETLYDSSINSNDGTGYNLQSDDQVDGQIDGSIDFDNNQDYIDCGNDTSLNVGSNDFSLSLWFKYDGVDMGVLAGKGAVTMARRYRISIESGPGMLMAEIDDNTVSRTVFSTSTYGDSLWHHVFLVRDGNNLRLYIDGVEDPNSPTDITGYGSLDEVESFYIGAFRSEIFGTLGYWSTANTDEVRVADMALSPGWIATEYNNQLDPNSFYSMGAELSAQPIEFDYKKDIVVDHTKVDADLTDFPLLIDIYDTDLRTDVQPDGDDIAFKIGGVTVDHEIELFDQTYSLTYAHLVVWVRANLSSSADTVVSMYYGNPSLGSQENPEGVWSNGYASVWHLDETSGGSSAIIDSTANNNDGTDYNSPTFAQTGKINTAIAFDGTNQYIEIPNSATLEDITEGDYTYECWFYADQVPPGTGA